VADWIAGSDDPRVADYAHIGDPAWLRDHGLFVAEGRLVVERLILARRFRVRSLLLTAAAREKLAATLAAVECPVHVATREVMQSLTGFDFHRGCLALAERGDSADMQPALAAARRLLCLEGVANPDNVGGLFRIAEAFRADAVLLDPSSGDPLYRKAIRTSMGAALRLPFRRLAPWPGALASLQNEGFLVVALTPRESARPLNDYVRALHGRERLIVIAGAEGSGLSADALQRANVQVRIPIAVGVDSLNVVAAAAVALAALWPVLSDSPS
jgi:tRNA G18 (ribose-2'-O)-methylase SpoU